MRAAVALGASRGRTAARPVCLWGLLLGLLLGGCGGPRTPVGEGTAPRPREGPGAASQGARLQGLALEAPEAVRAGQAFTVQVFVTDAAAPQGPAAGQPPAGNGPRPEAWPLEVVLAAPGFALQQETPTAQLVLPPTGSSSPVVFHLRAPPVPPEPPVRTLVATLWHHGVYQTTIRWDVRVDPPLPPGGSGPLRKPPDGGEPPASRQVHATVLDLDAEPPDLTVYVVQTPDGQRSHTATLILASPYLQPSLHVFAVPPDLTEWLEAQYTKFALDAPRGLSAPPPSPQAARPLREQTIPRLRGFGRQLYDTVAPPAFHEALWRLADQLGPRFQSIQIYSNLPFVPWELMRPTRADGTEERDFLGVEFRVARWHVTTGGLQRARPPQTMAMTDVVVVAPEYTGPLRLRHQADELQALAAVPGAHRVAGRLAALQHAWYAFPSALLHFTGHGLVQPTGRGLVETVLRLEDITLDVLTWRGMVAAVHRGHPFVFLNACNVGQASPVANFVEGWAPTMLEVGAQGYIGGLWTLGDQGAAAFAVHFYDALQRGLAQGPVKVADLLRATRRLFYDNGDPTFLAYVYYGDPNLQFTRVLTPQAGQARNTDLQ